MDLFEFCWLYAQSSGTTTTTYTVSQIPPGTNVLATISLSYAGIGFGGGGGAMIQSYDVFLADNSVETVLFPSDYKNNALYIQNCASVTFSLWAAGAKLYAQATVFTL